jgi:hypothetical protein
MPECSPSAPLEHQSSQCLNLLLRTASNRLEMLRSPDQPHHEDDVERQRIRSLTAHDRENLHHESMRIILLVRAEFRRRTDSPS